MLRRTPLRRKTPIKPRRTKPRRGPVRDKAFKKLICSLPCLLSGWPGAGPCSGRVDPDHLGHPNEIKRAGQQADDTTCVPMCRLHHKQRTDHWGFFADWSDDQREHWRRWALGKTQLMLAEKRTGLRVIPFPEMAPHGDADVELSPWFGAGRRAGKTATIAAIVERAIDAADRRAHLVVQDEVIDEPLPVIIERLERTRTSAPPYLVYGTLEHEIGNELRTMGLLVVEGPDRSATSGEWVFKIDVGGGEVRERRVPASEIAELVDYCAQRKERLRVLAHDLGGA
jgi:hypothetical protein